MSAAAKPADTSGGSSILSDHPFVQASFPDGLQDSIQVRPVGRVAGAYGSPDHEQGDIITALRQDVQCLTSSSPLCCYSGSQSNIAPGHPLPGPTVGATPTGCNRGQCVDDVTADRNLRQIDPFPRSIALTSEQCVRKAAIPSRVCSKALCILGVRAMQAGRNVPAPRWPPAQWPALGKGRAPKGHGRSYGGHRSETKGAD